MNIPEIISVITNSECANCRTGKALLALRELIDEKAVGADIAGRGEIQPAIESPPAVEHPSRVSAAPIHNNYAARGNPIKATVLDYLRRYPNSKAQDIPKATGLTKNQVKHSLLTLAKEKKVKKQGNTNCTRWNLSENETSNIQPLLPPAGSEEKKYHCPHCSRAFRNLLNLQQHKELHHPAREE